MSAQRLPTTVLLAEDDPNDVWLISRTLLPLSPGLNVQVVRDGEEAMAYLSGEGRFADRAAYPFPALVLLDIQLPRVDGLQVLRWIRQQPRFRGLIVLILSGSESSEHIQLAYDLHVNSFLRKSPFLSMPEASRNMLSYWLEMNQVPPPPPAPSAPPPPTD